MTRHEQKRASKGSQHWLQSLVDSNDAKLSEPIAEFAGVSSDAISWLSPLSTDNWAEYRDQTFLDL